MKCFNYLFLFLVLSIFIVDINGKSYNLHGQTGLISLPSAETHDQQSIYLTFNKNSYYKIGTLTVTPFEWMEASFFYYRPDDLLWGAAQGLYLDKGFNVKFSYKPKSIFLPRLSVGLDDFAGTGIFTREYITTTYDFNNVKITSGLGWGKFVGNSSSKNPLSFLNDRFKTRSSSSDNFDRGGNLSYDLWFRGDVSYFAGLEIKSRIFSNVSYKIESNPYDYFKFGCCGEGKTNKSFEVRKKESDINFGISYKFKEFGNIDLSLTQGNAWNLSFSLGFSSNKSFQKKNKFQPVLQNTNHNQDKASNEFYLDLLENLNRNSLFLQTASLKDRDLSISIDSSELINPIIYTSRSAYIAKTISDINQIPIDTVEVGQVTRGAKINSIKYRTKDLNLKERYPAIIIKKYTDIKNPEPNEYLNDEFKPKVNFPVFFYSFSPNIRTHVGSPQRAIYSGVGIKAVSEIQFSRNITLSMNIAKSLQNNFDKKLSDPNSRLELVRTEIVDYLQQSSDSVFINYLDIESIWSPYRNIWAKLSIGYLEPMYGGISSEILYKPFNSNFAFSSEFNSVKKRYYDQRFSFLDYETNTYHFNVAYYEPKTNILAKWSLGKYLAGDRGYTLDFSRRMPSGWRAGFYFSRTNVSAEEFGEGSFDKGFYFHIPLSIFSKDYNKDSTGFSLKTMTRDGGQKLELRNKLIDSFYGSTEQEINENWNNYLD